MVLVGATCCRSGCQRALRLGRPLFPGRPPRRLLHGAGVSYVRRPGPRRGAPGSAGTTPPNIGPSGRQNACHEARRQQR
eukprot:scaffold260122_cov43-Prasinocladus_malaysianus.AAC.1